MTIKAVGFNEIEVGANFRHRPEGALCRKICTQTWRPVGRPSFQGLCKIDRNQLVYPYKGK